MSRIRALAGDVDLSSELVGHRSLFWNILAPASGPRALGRLLRLPRRHERQAAMAALERLGLLSMAHEPAGTLSNFDRMRFLVARALARRPRYLVVREPDTLVGGDAVRGRLTLLRLIAHTDRLGVVVSLADRNEDLVLADSVLLVADGLLLFEGRIEGFPDERAAWCTGRVTS